MPLFAAIAHPALAGLALDIFGAGVIATTVLTARRDKWVSDAEFDATIGAHEGIHPRRDIEHAAVVSDTRVGALVLAAGFALQLVGGLKQNWPAHSAAWSWPLVAFAIGAVIVHMSTARRIHERDIYVERLRRADGPRRRAVHEAYGNEFRDDPDRLSELERWRRAAEEELGSPLW